MAMAEIEVTRIEPTRNGIRATVDPWGRKRGLLVVATLEPRGARLAMIEMSIVRDPMYPNPTSEMSSAVLRSIHVLSITRAVLAHMAFDAVARERPDIVRFLRKHQAVAERAFVDKWQGHARSTVGRKPKFGDDELRALALAALTAHRAENGVHAELVRQFPDQLRNKQQARDAVRTARREGFLAPAKHGQIDFQPGPRLTRADTNEGQQ